MGDFGSILLSSSVSEFSASLLPSSHHCIPYLILAYAGSAKAAEDVGFYYAANAGGRLMGILLSSALMSAGGIEACLWGSTRMLGLCIMLTFLVLSQRMPHVAFAPDPPDSRRVRPNWPRPNSNSRVTSRQIASALVFGSDPGRGKGKTFDEWRVFAGIAIRAELPLERTSPVWKLR